MSGFTERSTQLALFVQRTVEHDHSGVWESTETFWVDSARRDLSNDTQCEGFPCFPWFLGLGPKTTFDEWVYRTFPQTSPVCPDDNWA